MIKKDKSLKRAVNKTMKKNTEKINKIYVYRKKRFLLPLMLAVLIFTVVISTAIGAVSVPFLDTMKIILLDTMKIILKNWEKDWGFLRNIKFREDWESIIFYVRFPRVVTTMLVGAALGTSGAVMQGMFRNPMADPGVLGVSSGAGLGAVIAIFLGLPSRGIYFMPLFASIGALTASFMVFLLSSKGGKIPTINMILSGIAISMFFGAVTTAILSFIRSDQVKQFLFWTMGSLNGRRWEDVRISVIPILICITVLFFYSRDLNILLLGEEEAQSVGLNPSKTRRQIMFFSSVLAASAVSVSGTISFVGLMVPHIIRLLIGPDHRVLIPASALGGAIFLLICDLIGRTVMSPGEISVGIVTSLLGAPYFLFLLNKAKKEGAAL
jgi:iron complex transport system permease protein